MEKTPGRLEIVLQYFDDFTFDQTRQLTALGDLYNEWNTKINVISRKDIDSLYEKHILHSLAIAAAFDFQPDMEVLDIGTGGGFPGIPLAIFFPRTRFHLVDSIGKKIKVVDAVATAIGLTNVTTAHLRAEEIKGRKFDVTVSRAVAPLKDLWTWSRPLLRKSGAITQPSSTSTQPPGTATTQPSAANPIPSGLITLKGGDLAAEISQSGLRPRMIEIYQLFPLDYFHQKYLLQVPYP
ncbi:MAG TPA: 16S rRNA (guanine(527)-N(7))-methyltransferase RsmG [Puia sp.]|nr:16S rRNA (guanine(527)-N(7))-methyltransferase RsmG [Puia sp.]